MVCFSPVGYGVIYTIYFSSTSVLCEVVLCHIHVYRRVLTVSICTSICKLIEIKNTLRLTDSCTISFDTSNT